ncbi:DUF4192 family protein [Microbacterium sp. NPDC057407]|uniref:DUF4192 family protein n=1 Tax=Microbacterium sp. NPDC057407 TaxID=3346120 RepID=UPI00366E816F
MNTIVKAASAAEFLSLVPRMLGYVPTRSLVLVAFEGSRSLGALRFDLPDGSSDSVDRVAATVVGMVCRLAAADAVAVIAYTDESFDGGRMPHLDVFDAIHRRTDACGLRTSDALCVAADGWASRFDADTPAGGRPLAELDAVPVGAEGIDVAAHDQAGGADLPAVDFAEKERVGRALRDLERAVAVVCGGSEPGAAGVTGARNDVGDESEAPGTLEEEDRVDPLALSAVGALDDLPALFDEALEWRPDALDPYEAATLAWCLARPALRDVALVQWTGTIVDGDEALDGQLRWESGEEYPTHLAMRLWGEGDRPDPDRLETALELTRRLAASAPRAARAGALSMCAWLSWALGRSTHADRYAAEACAIEPEHGLSEIVRSFVAAGHLPDWAFRAPSASGAR